ncbi:MAG: hypothetical protein LM513_02360, partial [Nitrospira sp.]|nr:hypothetical protein [Nitrospira sp.]
HRFLRCSDFRSTHLVDCFLEKIIPAILDEKEATNIDSGITVDINTSLADFLSSAVEEFIISHEIAHLMLNHHETTSVIVESEADQCALESMIASGFDKIPVSWLAGAEVEQIEVNMAGLGCFCLRLWTIFRLMVESRVIPWVYQDLNLIANQRHRLQKTLDDRIAQTTNNKLMRHIVVQPIYKIVNTAFNIVIDELLQIDISPNIFFEIAEHAKTFVNCRGELKNRRLG